MKEIIIQPITANAFAPYGDVIEVSGTPDKIINQGLCGRFHDRARMEFGPDGRAGISLFQAELRALPLTLDMVERHPVGSQAFLPMSMDGFLVVVAPDENGAPGTPLAFMTKPGQGVNYFANTWHGVLTPLGGSGLFAVVDRIGTSANLEEFWYDLPFLLRN